MTKFAEPKFSVAAPATAEYDEGYARTFPASLDEKACTECLGRGRIDDTECIACRGTARRAWQVR